MPCLSFSAGVRFNAMHIPTERNTCMLGNTLVGVSVIVAKSLQDQQIHYREQEWSGVMPGHLEILYR